MCGRPRAAVGGGSAGVAASHRLMWTRPWRRESWEVHSRARESATEGRGEGVAPGKPSEVCEHDEGKDQQMSSAAAAVDMMMRRSWCRGRAHVERANGAGHGVARSRVGIAVAIPKEAGRAVFAEVLPSPWSGQQGAMLGWAVLRAALCLGPLSAQASVRGRSAAIPRAYENARPKPNEWISCSGPLRVHWMVEHLGQHPAPAGSNPLGVRARCQLDPLVRFRSSLGSFPGALQEWCRHPGMARRLL
jgi:hypothetical protein